MATSRKSTIKKNRRLRRLDMKSYLNYFYNLDLKENDCNPPTKSSKIEDELYEKLETLLTKEEFKVFEKFIDTYGDRMAEECNYYFKKGFKIAIRLIMECCNDDDIKENEYENLF